MMRDSEIKILLKGYCEAPDNMKKDAFIRSIGKKQQFEKVSFVKMLALQARSIRKRMWIISILLLAWAVFNISGLESEKVEIISKIMPFFACFGMIEGCRAKMHEMSELEGTTLFSAKGAYFAKMAVIAMAHFFTIVLLAVFMPGAHEKGCLIVMARLLIPYIVTSILSMEAERSIRSCGKDTYRNSVLCGIGRILRTRDPVRYARYRQPRRFQSDDVACIGAGISDN